MRQFRPEFIHSRNRAVAGWTELMFFLTFIYPPAPRPYFIYPQCNYWWGTFLLSEFIRFVISLFLELLIWIVFWLSLLNLFHVISVSNLFIHRVHTYSRIWTGVSHLRAPHPASIAPSNWTYFYFHFNKLKSHLFPISFRKDFLHSFNF